MKATKIAYYVTTGIISAMMVFIAFETLTQPEVKESLARLGFPDYFRIELGITKLIGAVLIWIPFRLLKEIAYIGFAFTFVSAFIAHLAVGDPLGELIGPIVFLAILVVSYISNEKIQKNKIRGINN